MLSTSLLASTPFNNRTALVDLAGILELYHAALAASIARTTGGAVRKYPLGNGRGDPDWLDALTKQHAAEADALGLIGPPSFGDFNLRHAGEFASFTFLLANDLQRL